MIIAQNVRNVSGLRQEGDILSSELARVIRVVQDLTYKDEIPHIVDLQERFPHMSYARIWTLLMKGVEQGLIDARYHPEHGYYYYAYAPAMRGWRQAPWYVRLYRYLKAKIWR